MTISKLYIVEGIPGSGKTSTATWLAKELNEQGKNAHLFLEGDPKHPADYESVASLNENQINEIEMNFPFIRNFTVHKGKWFFIPYASFSESNPDLHNALQKFDVYELSVADYCEVTLMRWQEFAELTEGEDKVYVLECCFLQNPFTFLLAKHNVAKEEIFAHIEKIAKKTTKLNPVILYFEQDNIKESLDRVRKERSEGWFQFISWYYTEQGYGQSRGIAGETGVLHFLEDRKKLEKEVLQNLPIKNLIINNSNFDWDKCKEQIIAFI
jgi:DNA polymerase III delta prime subunit